MGNSFGDSIKKIGYLQDELRNSYKFIIEGFRYVEKNDHENDFYFLMFQSFSQGFERFMKSYICLAYKNSEGSYPDDLKLKTIGHNLFGLLNEITDKYFIEDRDICKEDYSYLKGNSDFKALFNILCDFAKYGRYHNLDGVFREVKKSSPKSQWRDFEDDYFKRIGMDEVMLYPREYKEREVQLASYIKSLFERFMTSLVRQIQFKYLGQEALSLIIWDYSIFGGLRKGDYGKIDYSKVKIESRSSINKPRKNNISNSKNVKEKILYRYDFITWPFFVDAVIVKKEVINSYKYCTVIIEDFEYSLNGLAKSKFRIPTPHEAEKAKIGVSLSEFIEVALSL